MRALAIDWGRSVGLALWDGEQHTSWTIGWDRALDVIVPNFVYAQPVPPAVASRRVDLVVCEDFEISGRTVKSAVAEGWKRGRELMLIGATEFMCRQTGVEMVLQSPAEAKDFCSDGKLKRIEWYRPGPDHARDASRHLLLALVRRGVVDPRRLLSESS